MNYNYHDFNYKKIQYIFLIRESKMDKDILRGLTFIYVSEQKTIKGGHGTRMSQNHGLNLFFTKNHQRYMIH